MRCRLTAAVLMLVVTGPALGSGETAAAGTDRPRKGVLYSGRHGDGRVRIVQVGRLRGRPLLLLDVEVECGGFSPEGRGVAVVEDGGRFEVVLDATDTDTSDTVTGIFDDIDGRIRADAAVLEIDVDVNGEDNAGPTGSCEETQEWRLRGRPDRGAAQIAGVAPVDADVVAVGTAGVLALRHADGSTAEVTRVDPDTGRATWRVDVGRRAEGLATAGDAVWVLDGATLTVRRLDVATGAEVARIAIVPAGEARASGSVLTPMVATETAVWVGADGLERLFRIDTVTNGVTASVATPGGVRALAPAPDGVFAAIGNPAGGARGGRLVHFGAAGTEEAALELEMLGDDLVFDGSTLWMRDVVGTVTRHDPSTLARHAGELTFRPGTLTEGLVAAVPGVWTSVDQGLLAINDALRREHVVPVVGAAPSSSTAAGPDGIWVADSGFLMHVET